MSMPDFIIFGAIKSGSTSLCNYLIQHPDIYITTKKEPNFFLYPEGAIIPKNGKINSLENYQYFFEKPAAKTKKVRGEGSVSYICTEGTPQRIFDYLPNVKLIAILRHPVERIYSHYLYLIKEGTETASSLTEALENDRNSPHPFGYFQHGLYGQSLETYYSLFPASQIKIYLFEEFAKNPLAVTQDVFQFLDVDPSFTPNVEAKDAVSGIPRNRFIYNFIHQPNIVKDMVKPLVQMVLPKEKRRVLWTKAIESSLKKPKLDLSVRQTLLEDYRSDILRLQDILGRDLSSWLNKYQS